MSDKPVKEKTEKVVVPSVPGMVVYTDGGARPNPGFGGFGIHGYLFDTATPVKGIGLGPEMASTFGYAPSKELMAFDKAPELNTAEKILNVMDKSDKSWSVMPTSFIDTYGSLATMVTNNACEIIGVNTALQFAIDHQVKYIQIRTDSKLTRDAANEWVHGWAKNGWVTRDGAPVKNLELVKSLKRNLDTLADSGSVVKIDWIRAHNGDTGNEAADKLATMGVFTSRTGVEKTDIKVSPAQGYWKNDAEKHPFIAHKRMYFNTLAGASTPGVYFLGDTGKDDEQFGKKMSDGTFSVVRLEIPEPLLEQIRNIQSKYSNYADSLFKVYVDQLYSPGVFKLLNSYGEISIEPPSGYRLDLTHVTGAPLTREYKPARLAWRAVDALTGMSTWLDEFLAGDAKIISTNITPIIYDIAQKVVKGKKGEEDKVETEYKLRPELVVGLSSLKVDINHPLGKDEKIELALAVGIDILERNALKRLEDLQPEIYVITWVEGTGVYRYATVAKAGGSVGIWAGVYSNIRMIT